MGNSNSNKEEPKVNRVLSKVSTLMVLNNIPKNQEQNNNHSNPPGDLIKRPKELERFDKSLPCTLESNNSEDNIRANHQFFNNVNPENINYYKFDHIDANINQSELTSSKNNDFNISFGIPISDVDLELKFGYGKSNKVSLNSKKLNIKMYFYKIEIKPERISIANFYKTKIERVAYDNNLNSIKKAEELYELLKGTGIFVPLAAYIGASKVFYTDKISDEKAKNFELEFKAEFGKLVKV